MGEETFQLHPDLCPFAENVLTGASRLRSGTSGPQGPLTQSMSAAGLRRT